MPLALGTIAVLVGACAGLGTSRTPSTEEIESFAEIELPPSAREIEAELIEGDDNLDILDLRFTLDRDELRPFIRSAAFRAGMDAPRGWLGFQPGRNPLVSTTKWSDEIEAAGETLGLSEGYQGRKPRRRSTIVLDDPRAPVVYLSAFRDAGTWPGL